MLNVAYIFPGQGAQYVGMGQDFYQQFPQAQTVFKQADSLLGLDLIKLIFEGPLAELTRTVNCQVAVFTVSVACLQALQSVELAIDVKYTAGLSLGEYTALVAAGALSFPEALKLVRMRAQYMEEAAERNPGGMIALFGLSLKTVEKICKQASVEIANLNCPGQIVISGKLAGLEKAKQQALDLGVKQVVSLKVGGAFHSSLMAPASQNLSKALEKVEIRPPRIAVISNVTAAEENSAPEIRDNLAQQVVSRTCWEDAVRFIIAQGIKSFLEIGPGKVLKGLLRKIDPEVTVYNIGTVQDLERLRKEHARCC